MTSKVSASQGSLTYPDRSGLVDHLPSGSTKGIFHKTIECGHRYCMFFSVIVVVFHRCVKLPEGNDNLKTIMFPVE